MNIDYNEIKLINRQFSKPTSEKRKNPKVYDPNNIDTNYTSQATDVNRSSYSKKIQDYLMTQNQNNLTKLLKSNSSSLSKKNI